MFVLFVQRAYRYGTVGSFIICYVCLGVYWCVCSFIYLSVCGYGTTGIKLLNFVVQVIMQGVCVSVCMCICVSMTYMSVGMGPQA